MNHIITIEQSRGFGFITVPNEAKMNEILSSQPHCIKGEKIECKRAFPKELNSQHLQNKSIGNMLNSQNRKIFVGGLPPATTKEIMIQFFRRYGEIEYCIVMTDKATDKPRGIFLFIISSQALHLLFLSISVLLTTVLEIQSIILFLGSGLSVRRRIRKILTRIVI